MEIPMGDIDLFSRDSVRDARRVDDALTDDPPRHTGVRLVSFELAGDPKPWMTTIGHGPVELPVRIRPL
jgi:hypothetical protein